MDANHLLLSVGHIMALPDLKFDDQGCARLVFDQTLALDLEHDAGNDCIHLYSVLGEPPAGESGEALYRRLLEANLADSRARNGMLAYDEQSREIVLCDRVDLATASVDGTVVQIERFLDAVERWKPALSVSHGGPSAMDQAPHWDVLLNA